MNSFDRILKLTEWANKLAKPYPYNPALDSFLETQRQLKRSFSGFDMVMNITKKLRLDSSIKPYHFDVGIPKHTINTIELIRNQHKQYFSHLKDIQNSIKVSSTYFTHINSLQIAINSLSNQIGDLAVKQKDWTIIDDFEEFNSQAIELSQAIIEEPFTEQEKQFKELLSALKTFLVKYKTTGKFLLRSLEIFAVISTLYIIFIQENPELATKSDLKKIDKEQESIINFLEEIKQQLKDVNEFRIVDRECKVMLKPKTKTTIITKLPLEFEVSILQVNHKWVLISYFDPKDNLPQTGGY